MKKNRVLLLIIVLTLLNSCEKHLNLLPISSITNDSFWTSKDDVNGAVNGLYAKLRASASVDLFIWGEARSEMMERSLVGTLGYERYYDQTLSSIHSGPSWDNMYSLINTCNLIIKYAPIINYNDDNERSRALAQAYTMRAYAYFLLVRVWGGVPLRLEPLEKYDPQKIQLPRSPKEEILKLIKADIDKGLLLFPDNNIPKGRNKWSMPSAYALKGDIYLWTAKREDGGTVDLKIALESFDEVLSSDVQLLENYADIFEYSNKGNKEIIMSIRFFLNESGEQTFAHNMYLPNVANLPSYVPQWQKDIVGVARPGNGNVWRITKLVRDQFSDDDTRKAATYIDIQSENGGKYYTNFGLKFNGLVSLGQRYFLDDWIIYRYADILLMKAEAKNALNQDPSEEINLIRKRAYKKAYDNYVFVNASKESNDEQILKERLFELSLEGKRWWDLVRFDKTFELVPKLEGRELEKHLLLWPISRAALTKEVLVEQTAGYE